MDSAFDPTSKILESIIRFKDIIVSYSAEVLYPSGHLRAKFTSTSISNIHNCWIFEDNNLEIPIANGPVILQIENAVIKDAMMVGEWVFYRGRHVATKGNCEGMFKKGVWVYGIKDTKINQIKVNHN